MLSYQPFIDYLEAGGTFDGPGFQGRFDYEWLENDTPNWAKMRETMPDVLFKFMEEFWANFDDLPYLGGLRDLMVVEVSGRVRIHEYDGSESVEEEDEFTDWL